MPDGKPTFFDPKLKRNDFFRLRRGDIAQLVDFLNTSGLFESETSLFSGGRPRDDDGEELQKAIARTRRVTFIWCPITLCKVPSTSGMYATLS